MFLRHSSTGGTFTGDPSVNTTYYLKQEEALVPTPPTNATVDNVLTFSSTSDFTLQSVKCWDGTLYYSTDMNTWTEWDGGEIDSHNGNLYLCGVDNVVITDGAGAWALTGTEGIACSGNIENLLDYEKVARGEHPKMASYCYSGMFSGCTSLTTAPSLPATALANMCYYCMFSGCTSLTTAPSLPATALADYCYSNMFSGCTSLTTAPSFSATALACRCYSDMFSGCTSLTTAPSLPAPTLAYRCYSYMFYGCTSLKVSDQKIR